MYVLVLLKFMQKYADKTTLQLSVIHNYTYDLIQAKRNNVMKQLSNQITCRLIDYKTRYYCMSV